MRSKSGSKRETCQEYDNSQTKETLMSHDMSDRPWQKVGVDLFSYMGKDYLVTTDYKSNFWEISYLSSKRLKVCNHQAEGSLRKDGHTGHCR